MTEQAQEVFAAQGIEYPLTASVISAPTINVDNINSYTNSPSGPITIQNGMKFEVLNGTSALIMPAVTSATKLVLFPTDPNLGGFSQYGFGVSGGQLDYSVDSTSHDHVFYAATSNVAHTEVARIKGTGGIQFANSTSGYTPSPINYYEEYYYTDTFTGPFTSSQTANMKIVRLNNTVFLSQLGSILAGQSTATYITSTIAIPTRFLPSSTGPFSSCIVCTDNAISSTSSVYVNPSTGILNIFKSAVSNFGGTGNLTINTWLLTWSIS